jgi:hypothetical protein
MWNPVIALCTRGSASDGQQENEQSTGYAAEEHRTAAESNSIFRTKSSLKAKFFRGRSSGHERKDGIEKICWIDFNFKPIPSGL